MEVAPCLSATYRIRVQGMVSMLESSPRTTLHSQLQRLHLMQPIRRRFSLVCTRLG
jgi:hypothetical protein